MVPDLPQALSNRLSTSFDTHTAQVVKEELCRIIDALPNKESSSGCIVIDLSNFLVEANYVLAEFGRRISRGSHVDQYIKDRLEQMKKDTDFAFTGPLDIINERHHALRNITKKLEQNSKDIKALCENSAGSLVEIAEDQSQTVMPYRVTPSSLADDASPAEGPSNSTPNLPGNDEEIIDEINALLKSVEVRGKGSHKCPYGLRCDKGGVDAGTGEIVVFERHSKFKNHLEKHQKRYKCDLPNCPSRTGIFARADLLRRHQQNISHAGPSST